MQVIFTLISMAPTMAVQVIGADSPQAMSTLFGNIARRLSAAREARLRKGKPDKVRGGAEERVCGRIVLSGSQPIEPRHSLQTRRQWRSWCVAQPPPSPFQFISCALLGTVRGGAAMPHPPGC